MAGEKKKHPGGRPTKYNAQFHPLLAESLARNGLTNEQIAEKMGLATSTVSLWMNEHQEFSDALKRGREEPDDKVERSLYKLATGFEYEAEKPMVVSIGNNEGSEVQLVKYRERVLPNTTAQIFWLKNRRPDRWRDKQEIEHSGFVDDVSPEQRRKRLAELEAKRKAKQAESKK